MALVERSRNKAALRAGLIFGIAQFILLCAVTAGGPKGWWRDFCLWQFGNTGDAVITRAVADSNLASHEYNCDYRFEYGRSWYATDTHVGSCIEGETVLVRYMPSDPAVSTIRPPFAGRSLSLALILLLSVLGGGGFCARKWDKLHRESKH